MVVEAPFAAGVLVVAILELVGGAVYTVVTSAGRDAAAPPGMVVVPLTESSISHVVPM